MTAKIATTFHGSMDEYVALVKNDVYRATLLQKYTAKKAVERLGTPPADKQEIKLRIKEEKRNKRRARRARRLRVLRKIAKLRLVAHTIAAAAVTLGCPAMAPPMAAIVFQTYLETKLVEHLSNRADHRNPVAVKDAKVAIKALKAAKKQAPSAAQMRRMANKGR